jgi:bifunctional pyridoxal-dependent enzyme with beta-cystathionase and maltose regulon repressor activities
MTYTPCAGDLGVRKAVASNVRAALKTPAGLVVNPGYQFGPRGVGHFRICFAQDEAAWADALKRIVSTVHALAENG